MSRYAVATAREGVLQWRREGLLPAAKRYCNGVPGRIRPQPGGGIAHHRFADSRNQSYIIALTELRYIYGNSGNVVMIVVSTYGR